MPLVVPFEWLKLCRIKSYILKRRLMPKLMKPVQCREKWLVIAAIRFLRTCISMKDEFYYRSAMQVSLCLAWIPGLGQNPRLAVVQQFTASSL